MQLLPHRLMFIAWLISGHVSGFSPGNSFTKGRLSQTLQVEETGFEQSEAQIGLPQEQSTALNRRVILSRMFTGTLTVIGASGFNVDQVAYAAKSTYPPGTVFRTGKAPLVPGGKLQSKDDVSGTRKDPNFLRSVADCKNKCENTQDSDGRTRTKEECLSECQDICCTTYEQCTFGIVPRV